MNYKHIKSDESESIYEITGKQSRIIKKYHDSHLQITMYDLSEGRVLYAEPVNTVDSFKTYYVISGRCLVFESGETLESGDFLVYSHQSDLLTLKTLEPTVLMVHASNYDAYETIQAAQEKVEKLLLDIQNKDHYTGEHSLRVYELVKKLGIRLGYKATALNNLNKAAYYHDLGKIFIDDSILNKPGKLTESEYDAIKLHATLSEELILTHFNKEVYKIISQHHERWNGKGYPFGLAGEDILEESRILAICDSYDAMITDRIYKAGKSEEQALQELTELSGILYDKHLVDEFVKMMLE